jgi:hypothetical protein
VAHVVIDSTSLKSYGKREWEKEKEKDNEYHLRFLSEAAMSPYKQTDQSEFNLREYKYTHKVFTLKPSFKYIVPVKEAKN